jgi:hypothetical protein
MDGDRVTTAIPAQYGTQHPMFATENTSPPAITLIRNLTLLVLLLVCTPCLVVAQGTAGLAEDNGTSPRPHSAIESMVNTQQAQGTTETAGGCIRKAGTGTED